MIISLILLVVFNSEIIHSILMKRFKIIVIIAFLATNFSVCQNM